MFSIENKVIMKVMGLRDEGLEGNLMSDNPPYHLPLSTFNPPGTNDTEESGPRWLRVVSKAYF